MIHQIKRSFKLFPELFNAEEFINGQILRFQACGFLGSDDAALQTLKDLDKECQDLGNYQTYMIHQWEAYDKEYSLVHDHAFRAAMVSMFRDSDAVLLTFVRLGWDVPSLLKLEGEGGDLNLSLKVKSGRNEITLQRDGYFYQDGTKSWFYTNGIRYGNTSDLTIHRISKAEIKRLAVENNPKYFIRDIKTSFGFNQIQYKYIGV